MASTGRSLSFAVRPSLRVLAAWLCVLPTLVAGSALGQGGPAPAPKPERRTETVVCTDVRGVRLAWFEAAEAGTPRRKPVQPTADGFSGLAIVLEFSRFDRTAEVRFEDRTRLQAVVRTLPMLKISSTGGYSFVALDRLDDQPILITYFPSVNRLVWSSHAGSVDGVGTGAIGKLFFGACRSAGPTSRAAP